MRATSRDNGEYAITRVPSGTYTLRVRRLGYFAPTASVTIAEGQTVERDFLVNRAAVSLREVVVGSRARHTAADELAVPVDVFTPQQIQSQGTTETAQILSQLTHFAGVVATPRRRRSRTRRRSCARSRCAA